MCKDILSKIDQPKLSEVAQLFQLNLIVLFGSHAKGRAIKGSDIDIGIRTSRRDFRQRAVRSEMDWEMNLFAGLSEAIDVPYDMDVVFLNTVGSTLMFEVAKYGKLIYEKEPMAFHHFRSYAARRFYDDAKFRRLGWEWLKRRCAEWQQNDLNRSDRN